MSVVSVTAAWRWQACREARGPGVVSLCYTASSLSILLHLAHCPVLLPQRLSACHQRRGTTLQKFQLYFAIISISGAPVSSSSFVTYSVLLRVAHCPSVSLQGSACCLLLLDRHSDLSLDALVHRCGRPGALLLLRALVCCRSLRALIVMTKHIKSWAFISIRVRQKRSRLN